MTEQLHTWDAVSKLFDQIKFDDGSLTQEQKDSINEQIRILSHDLSPVDKKVLRILRKQEEIKAVDHDLYMLMKMHRWTLKLGKHFEHFSEAFEDGDQERISQHLARAKSRVKHLSDMLDQWEKERKNLE